MKRQIFALMATTALVVASGTYFAASAQDAAGGATTTTPPANPPTTTPPAAADDQDTAKPLPPVEVIQEQPKPKPKPVKQAKRKPRPAPAPVAVAPPPPAPVAPDEDATNAPQEDAIKMSPVGGSEIPLAKVPGGVSTVSAQDIASQGSVIPQEYLAQHVPGITVSDIQGNGFQTDIQYRGFESSPVNGVAQGIAVYQNGVRINESFGDVVNLDFLPEMAINNVTVISGNPAFGLNALGGAIVFDMKDGFNFHGAEFDFRAGSYGRIQELAQGGMQSGNFAAYIAAEHIDDAGFREFSPTQINRTYADLGFKGDGSEFHINFTGADNSYGVTAAAPQELLDAGYNRAFTSPQITDNKLAMVSINGTVKATDTMSISGVSYYRHFKQKHLDGNIAEFEECGVGEGAGPGFLCADGDGLVDTTGADVADPGGELGSIDKTSQNADSYGASLQGVEKAKLFGLGNQFLIGTSYDHGHVAYKASSEVGFFLPHFVVQGTGATVAEPDDFTPRNLGTANDYFGLFFSNTLDVTSRLALTFGGRYNYAAIALENKDDPTDTELNNVNIYERFNPMAGATYQLAPGLSLYGGYSEANRAPTAAELACADPDAPCLIESFLTADPPLKQVVSHTWELGVRGDYGTRADHFQWSAGLFHALNTNDIVTQIANDGTRGYFINAADTLRQGLEAAASYSTDRYRVYLAYNYTDATFRDGYEQFSPNNPNAGACNDPAIMDPVCLQVQSGDTLPGVARHKLKAGIDYWVTSKWKIGTDVIATSGQYLYGDENNSNSKLAGYAKVNMHTSYDVTDHVQVYGLIDNLFDTHFGTYGTFFDTDEASEASLGEFNFTNPRTLTPSQPFAAYGGVKVKF